MNVSVKLGKGLKFGSQVIPVFGAAKNDVITPASPSSPPSISGETSTFDVSSIYPDHEVVVALVNITGLTKTTTFNFEWHGPSGDTVYSYDYTVEPRGYTWWFAYSYIGCFSWELNGNGDCYVKITSDDGYSKIVPFTVTGVPADNPDDDNPDDGNPDEDKETAKSSTGVWWAAGAMVALLLILALFGDKK